MGVGKRSNREGIQVNTVDDFSEPVLRLLESVTPENSQRLSDLVRRGLAFSLDSEADDLLFESYSQTRRIVVGRKCLMRVRAHAFAYIIAYSDFANRMAEGSGIVSNLRGSEALLSAGNKMLTWAMAHDLQLAEKQARRSYRLEQIMVGGDVELPPELFDSIPAKLRLPGERLAETALAYIVFHEIVHIEMGDVWREGPDSIEQETQADRLAAEWMLGASPHSARTNRLLGIAVGLLWLASVNVYLGRGALKTHPPGYERLDRILGQYVDENNKEESEVWLFALLSLFLHVDNRKLKYDDSGIAGKSWREATTYLIDLISKQAPR
jgi:hypothetical protein